MAPAISVATGLYQVLTLPELVQKSFRLDDVPERDQRRMIGGDANAMQLPGTLGSVSASLSSSSRLPSERRTRLSEGKNGASKLLARGSMMRYGWLPSDGDPQGASKSMRDGLSRKRKPKRTRCTGRTGRGGDDVGCVAHARGNSGRPAGSQQRLCKSVAYVLMKP